MNRADLAGHLRFFNYSEKWLFYENNCSDPGSIHSCRKRTGLWVYTAVGRSPYRRGERRKSKGPLRTEPLKKFRSESNHVSTPPTAAIQCKRVLGTTAFPDVVLIGTPANTRLISRIVLEYTTTTTTTADRSIPDNHAPIINNSNNIVGTLLINSGCNADVIYTTVNGTRLVF